MTEHDDRHALKFGLGFMLFLLLVLSAIDVFAAQPASTATESEHLFFLGQLAVVVVCVLVCLWGASHGYAVGAKNDGGGG